jgi:sugar lactone lactonase YvrE
VTIPNAIAFAPDRKRFYLTDSQTRVVEAMRYARDAGEPADPEILVRYSEAEGPDGACIDAEGAIWIAVVNDHRLERRLPDGTLDTVVELPVSRPTMPMLKGSDGRTLFITSHIHQASFVMPLRFKLSSMSAAVLPPTLRSGAISASGTSTNVRSPMYGWGRVRLGVFSSRSS